MTAGAGVVAAPLRATVCGLVVASSVTVRDAVRLPEAAGAKLTEIVQEAPAASVLGLDGHVLVRPKSLAFEPASAMPVIDNGAVPEFVSVTAFDALVDPTSCDANVRLVGVSVTDGAGVEPVPLNVSVCGLLVALSVIVTVAARAPEALGAKVTEIVQEAPAASVAGLEGHVFVWAKSPAFAPANAMPLIESGDVPEFVSVAVFAALVDPSS